MNNSSFIIVVSVYQVIVRKQQFHEAAVTGPFITLVEKITTFSKK
jgi:hypothetical protein